MQRSSASPHGEGSRAAAPSLHNGFETTRLQLRKLQVDIEKSLSELGNLASTLGDPFPITPAAASPSSSFLPVRPTPLGKSSFATPSSTDRGNKSHAVGARLAIVSDTKSVIDKSMAEAEELLKVFSSLRLEPPQAAQSMRLRDVFDGFKREYRRTCSVIQSGVERESLMGQTEGRRKRGNMADDSPENKEFHHLLRERSGLDAAISMLDETIQSGQRSHASLGSQRGRFDHMGHKLTKLDSIMPNIGNLVQKIRRIKLRQQLILATVFGVCLLICLLWVFRSSST